MRCEGSVAPDFSRSRSEASSNRLSNNLGIALQNQGIRTGGAQGTELLAQAVAAYRSALEVYTREVFPAYYERVRQNLDALLAQANPMFSERG